MNVTSTNGLPVKSQPHFRPANLNDAVFIARLIREFDAKHDGIYNIPLDYASTLLLADDVIRRGVCIVGENSCAGAYLTPFPFNNKVIVAYIVFWCFQAAREITIFNALSAACKERGADYISGASPLPNNAMGKYYRRHGMENMETHYIGNIESCCVRKQKGVNNESMTVNQQLEAA